LDYRKAFYNELSTFYDVAVLHSGSPTVTPSDRYHEILVSAFNIGPFVLQPGIFSYVFKRRYVAVVLMADLRWFFSIFVAFFISKKKLVWWGLWITKSKLANRVRLYLSRRNKSIFYCHDERQRFIDLGAPAEQLFVANNTIEVDMSDPPKFERPRTTILSVGSLNKRKQHDVLIRAFANICSEIPPEINIVLIGNGSEKTPLMALCEELGVSDRVVIKDAITNSTELKAYYNEAIVSVSFGQAGLTVLQSFGNGVPFITKKNAISGGEKTNIVHDVSGLFCEDNQKSLEDALLKMVSDPLYSQRLAANAFSHYETHATIPIMVAGFKEALPG